MDASTRHAPPGRGRLVRWLVLPLAAVLLGGCRDALQFSDAELRRAILGSWAFENATAAGYMCFEPDNIMTLSAQGKNLALMRFKGDIRHTWEIEQGCLTVQVHDSSDVARLILWPGSTAKSPIKISHVDAEQLVLEDVGTFPRVDIPPE